MPRRLRPTIVMLAIALAVLEASVAPAQAALPRQEVAHYRVSHGLFGTVGEVTLKVSPLGAGFLRAEGFGAGDILGLGATEKTIAAELDPAAPVPRSWTTARVSSGKRTVDTTQVPRSGKVVTARQRSDGSGDTQILRRPRPIMDPLSFLLKVRAEPPSAPVTYDVLDGRALWAVTISPAQPALLDGPGSRACLWLSGHAQPLDWNGNVDDQRSGREFKLCLADDAFRTPLRLALAVPLGELRVDLVAVDRPFDLPAMARALSLRDMFGWLPRMRGRGR